jgi:hypothetical protein
MGVIEFALDGVSKSKMLRLHGYGSDDVEACQAESKRAEMKSAEKPKWKTHNDALLSVWVATPNDPSSATRAMGAGTAEKRLGAKVVCSSGRDRGACSLQRMVRRRC